MAPLTSAVRGGGADVRPAASAPLRSGFYSSAAIPLSFRLLIKYQEGQPQAANTRDDVPEV